MTATPQADGSVCATATGSFASCTICDAWDAAGQCTHNRTVTYGSIALYRDGAWRCTAGDNSAATCTSREDRGVLHGTHVFSATASDCVGSASSSVSLTLDNTPTVVVTAPSGAVTGPFDITGTATFHPSLTPLQGYLYLYVNNVYTYVAKACTTTTCTFSYQELAGKFYDLPHGGPYAVQLVAIGGGASASAQQTFTVAACTDADHDGYAAIDPVTCPTPLGTDCDDHDATVHPGAPEQCNGQDNNCNDMVGEGVCDGLTVCFDSALNPASGALMQRLELFAMPGTRLAIPLTLSYHSHDSLGACIIRWYSGAPWASIGRIAMPSP